MATTAFDLVGGDRSVVVARINGELKDLFTPVTDDDVVEGVLVGSSEGLAVLRHSTAHVLAQAVQDVFPDARLGIGPPIKDGFYYDFDVQTPFTPEDLVTLEKRMFAILKSGQRFVRRVVREEEAVRELALEPYKLRLIGSEGGADVMEVGGTELTVYDNVDGKTGERCWGDLCRGPHVPDTRYIPPNAFKLMRTAAAYWLGDQKNEQLQRVYGTAWPSKDELKAYLTFLEEAERRDHRRLGTELDLFSFPDEIGSGLAVFHPKGGVIRRVMEDYSRRRHEVAGYEFVNTPHITKGALFEKSRTPRLVRRGHVPAHAARRRRGCRRARAQAGGRLLPQADELPDAQPDLRRARALVPRTAAAALRVRHRLPVREVRRGPGPDTGARLHPGRRAHLLHEGADARRAGPPADLRARSASRLRPRRLLPRAVHPRSEEVRRAPTRSGPRRPTPFAIAAQKQELELVMDEGGAAFYGPKISVQAKDAIGRTWQMSTIQVDFNLPERFDLEYQSADGTRQRPVMIHRALFGSIERFFAVLLEHYAGAFPPWLAPVQVVAIPVTDAHNEYLHGRRGTTAGARRARRGRHGR